MSGLMFPSHCMCLLHVVPVGCCNKGVQIKANMDVWHSRYRSKYLSYFLIENKFGDGCIL